MLKMKTNVKKPKIQLSANLLSPYRILKRTAYQKSIVFLFPTYCLQAQPIVAS